MTKLQAAIIAVAVVIFSIGVYNVYGEELPDCQTFQQVYDNHFCGVVLFPIPDNVREHLQKCIPERVEGSVFVMDCKFMFVADDVEEWYNDIREQQESIPVPEAEAEPEEEKPPISPYIKPPSHMERYENDLERFVDNPPTRPSDKAYYEKLLQLAECQRGTGPALGIQQQDRFATSTAKLDPDITDFDAFNLKGGPSQLDKAIQECKAQRTILEPVTLGVEAEHRGQYFGTQQGYHANYAHYDEEFWANIPTHEDYAFDARDLVEEQMTAYERMCASEFVNTSFKRLQNCPIGALPSPDGTCKMGYVMNEKGNLCVIDWWSQSPQPLPNQNNNMENYGSQPLEKMKQYKADDGAEMYEELKREKLIETQEELRR